MKSLYELTEEFSDLVLLLESEEVSEDEIAFELAKISESVDAKAEGYAKILRNWAIEADGLATEIDRLTKRRKAVENASKRLKQHLQNTMVLMGKKQIATSIGKWSIRNNPPSAVITDFASIPARYLVPVDPKVDSRQIIADWKNNGELIPGVEIQIKQSLQFR